MTIPSRGKSPGAWAMAQAIADAGESVPVVLHRANGCPWLAIVPLDDLPRLAELLFLTLAAEP